MRDPDLIVRAQRAATALESAWCHWRNVHGLTGDPLPTVSSYVGYSLDAPWGEARIVFGICAQEAEQLAALLEHHDCVGPVHASVTARSVEAAGSLPSEGAAGQPGAAGLLHVPAPAPASAGQQPLSASAVGSRHDDLLAPRHRSPARDRAEPSPLTAPLAPPAADAGTPIARAASQAVEASMASKRAPAAGTSPAPAAAREAGHSGGPGQPGDGEDDRRGPEAAGAPEPSAAESPEAAAFRLKRPGSRSDHGRAARAAPATPADPSGTEDTVQTPAPGRSPGGRDRVTSTAAHADAATWAASEVPGHAAVSDPAV